MRHSAPPGEAPRVTVVIPFYQREAGFLRRALRSALAQEGTRPDEIVVVDDGSPVPARQEVRALPVEARQRTRVIRQNNAGPAAARNRALDSLGDSTDYVAFLDSDDEWEAEHLALGTRALQEGFDLFYADQHVVGEGRTVFQKTGRPPERDRAPLDGRSSLHAYRGDVVDEILSGNMRTSSLLYRYGDFPHVRFPVQLHYFGEDHTFLLDLARSTSRIALSTRVTSRYGSGVSIYSESEWGTPKVLRQNNHALRFRKSLLEREELDARQRTAARRRIRALRREFVVHLMHFLRNGKPLEWSVVRSQLRADPLVLLTAGPTALRVGLERAVATLRRPGGGRAPTGG